MREIKFRAWDRLTRQMMHNVENAIIMARRNIEFKVMQYTGLKDKKGREIYEGDIVREANPHTSLSVGLEVIFNLDVLQFGVIDTFKYFTALSDIKHDWQVIGNIYENPELLGDKGDIRKVWGWE